MMDNLGFEDSPLSCAIDSLPLRTSYLSKDKNHELMNENLTPEINSDYLDKIKSISSCQDNNATSPKSSSDVSPLIKDRNVKKLRSRRTSNKKKNSLLKQALFKPYVDSNENSEQENTKKSYTQEESRKRKPLGIRNTVVLTNLNSLEEKRESLSSDQFIQKSMQFPRKDLADKENVHVN